jgi:hypothetical protein
MSVSILEAGRLSMGVQVDGRITPVRWQSRNLPMSEAGGFEVTEVLQPNGRSRPLKAVTASVRQEDRVVHLTGSVPDAALALSASLSGGDYIDVAGELRDQTGLDRALRVSFTLPIDLRGWRWQQTTGSEEAVTGGTTYPHGRVRRRGPRCLSHRDQQAALRSRLQSGHGHRHGLPVA